MWCRLTAGPERCRVTATGSIARRRSHAAQVDHNRFRCCVLSPRSGSIPKSRAKRIWPGELLENVHRPLLRLRPRQPSSTKHPARCGGRPFNQGRTVRGVSAAPRVVARPPVPLLFCTSLQISARAGSFQRSDSLRFSMSGMGPPRRCRRAAGRARPSRCSIAPRTRCASAEGAPGHTSSTSSAEERSSANRGARSATTGGNSPSAAAHRSSSPYHQRTRARDSGDVITYLTANGHTSSSSQSPEALKR